MVASAAVVMAEVATEAGTEVVEMVSETTGGETRAVWMEEEQMESGTAAEVTVEAEAVRAGVPQAKAVTLVVAGRLAAPTEVAARGTEVADRVMAVAASWATGEVVKAGGGDVGGIAGGDGGGNGGGGTTGGEGDGG